MKPSVDIEIIKRLGRCQPASWGDLLALDKGHLERLCAVYKGSCPRGAKPDTLRRRLAAHFSIEVPRKGSPEAIKARADGAQLRRSGGIIACDCKTREA